MCRNPPGGGVPATAYNLFILEDHATMRRMLRLFVEESGMDVSGEAVSGEEALATTLPDEADLVLVDLSLPGMSGLEFIQKLHHRCPDCCCLVVSAHIEPFYAEAARKAGAVGFVCDQRRPGQYFGGDSRGTRDRSTLHVISVSPQAVPSSLPSKGSPGEATEGQNLPPETLREAP